MRPELVSVFGSLANLLHIDAVTCTAEYKTCSHGFGKPTRLFLISHGIRTRPTKELAWFEISS